MRNRRSRPQFTRKNSANMWILFYMHHNKKFLDQEWDQHQSLGGPKGKSKHEDMLEHQLGGDVGPGFLISFCL